MLRSLHSLLYGSVPAKFESKFDVYESARRLEAVTRKSALGALTTQAAVGTVTVARVKLCRVIPFVGNSYKPYFIGKFEQTPEGTKLTGQFTMHRLVKVFNTIWFGFGVFWTVLATFAVARTWPKQWYFPFFGVGLLLAGVAFMRLGKWFARNDIAWLSGVIQSALRGESAA